MAKTKKPEQAIFSQNFKGAIYGGTPEQVKNLMTAFCQYAFDGIDKPSVAPDIAMTFGMMKASVDADRKHYQEVCEQNRINALKKTGLTISGYVQSALDAGPNCVGLLQNRNIILQKIQSDFLCHLGRSQPGRDHIVSVAIGLHCAKVIGYGIAVYRDIYHSCGICLDIKFKCQIVTKA